MERELLAVSQGDTALTLPWEAEREEVLDRELSTVPCPSAVRRATAEWLQGFPLGVFATFTWSDAAIAERYIYTDRAAVKDVRRFLDKELGYVGQYYGVVEDHMHRDVPHVHMLMEDMLDWRFTWHVWHKSRGFFRSVPAKREAFLYVAKYMQKDGRCAERVFERLSM